MNKLILSAALLLAAPLALAQGIQGKWRTIDDESGKPKAVVQISQSGNTFHGRIVSGPYTHLTLPTTYSAEI